MDVRALVVHVLDPVVGPIILHPGTGKLGAAPGTTSASEGGVQTRLAENATVEASMHTVLMALRSVSRLASGNTVGSQLRQSRPEAGIDIPFQDFCDRHDMGIDVVHLESVPHSVPPFPC